MPTLLKVGLLTKLTRLNGFVSIAASGALMKPAHILSHLVLNPSAMGSATNVSIARHCLMAHLAYIPLSTSLKASTGESPGKLSEKVTTQSIPPHAPHLPPPMNVASIQELLLGQSLQLVPKADGYPAHYIVITSPNIQGNGGGPTV